MSEMTQARMRSAVVALAPIITLISFLLMPYFSDFTDNAKVAETVNDHPNRMAWAMVVVAFGLALAILAVFSIRVYVRAAGEERWSFAAVPLVTIGSATLILALGAEGLGTAGTINAGGNGEEYLDHVRDWTLPIQYIAGVVMSLGLLSLAFSIVKSGILSQNTGRLVAVALVVTIIGNFLPWGWALYVLGVAWLIAYLPVAYTMWGHAEEPTMQARPSMG